VAEVKRKKENGTWEKIGETPIETPIDLSGYYPAIPNIVEPGDWPLVSCIGSYNDGITSALQETHISVVLPNVGTYRMKWGMVNDYTGTCYGQIYHGNTPIGTQKSCRNSSENFEEEITSPEENYEVTLWFRMASGNNYEWGCIGGLEACIKWPDLEEILNARS